MSDLFEGYAAVAAPTDFDEMFTGDDVTRAGYRGIHDVLRPHSSDDLLARSRTLGRAYRDRGVTFSLSGKERPFPIDPVPRVIEADDWRIIERGLTQRVRALEAFLDDIYADGHILADGVVPRRLVQSSPHFHRCVFGLKPPGGVHIHVAGIDVIRDGEGTFRVLEDNLRSPSGVSYVMENRRMMARVFPDLFRDHTVAAVDEYPRRLLHALAATAPDGAEHPRIVVLTPGVANSAYFEHALLARLMGVDLVEGRDLVCQDDQLFVRTTSGVDRVDVVFRRIDDDFLDPVQFRPDSVLGVAGLVHAARAGNVTIANAIGNGVADDKLVYSYVPDIIRYYLGEEAILPNVETYRLDDPEVREDVLDRVDTMVIKPVDGSGGYGLVFGPTATDEELRDAVAAIEAAPRNWIAQPVVRLSTAPTLVDGRLRPRHIDLRPFAVNDGENVWVLPGGLTRVAIPEGSLVVNSSQGGGSKDTWVLADPAEVADQTPTVPVEDRPIVDTAPVPLQFGPADDRERLQQQQLQQQQQQQPSVPAADEREGSSC
jgi:uncharacterized circularly permuted ATP-grasp superfamily protein